MLQFTDQFRIYLLKHRRMVKWSIMVSPRSTDLYLIGTQGFEAVLQGWRSRTGTTTSDYGRDYFVQHKRVGTAEEYVRISVSGNDPLIREYRVSPDDMRWLEDEYARQSASAMPWDV